MNQSLLGLNPVPHIRLAAAAGRYVPITCRNGKLDDGEADVDCGGSSCNPCVSGKQCRNQLEKLAPGEAEKQWQQLLPEVKKSWEWGAGR